MPCPRSGRFLTTVNRKVIRAVYLYTAILMGMTGWSLSVIMRYELSKPGVRVLGHDTPEVYNMLVRVHGITMIFFLVMPNLFGGQGNAWMPLRVGTCEVAYPKLNNGSLSVLLASFSAALSAVGGEFLNGLGWVLYAPLSTRMMTLSRVTLVALAGALLVNGTSSTLTSTNYLGTLSFAKVNGFRLNLYATTIATAGVLLLGSLPFLTAALIMLVSDVVGNTTYFTADSGGDVIMYQHVFWMFGHPEVYVLALPAMGVAALAVTALAGSSVFGATGMMAGTVGIGVLGFVVWGHHMLRGGLDVDSNAVFQVLTVTIGIPTGTKVLHVAGSGPAGEVGAAALLSN